MDGKNLGAKFCSTSCRVAFNQLKKRRGIFDIAAEDAKLRMEFEKKLHDYKAEIRQRMSEQSDQEIKRLKMRSYILAALLVVVSLGWLISLI